MLHTLAEPTPGGEERALGVTVAVVIPSFRVAPYIADVIRSIPDFVAHIIVVDDASPDDTTAVVESMRDRRVTLVRHEENQGVGGAVMTGYAHALRLGVEVIVKMDGDGQMDASRIRKLVAPIAAARADYTKGNRFVHSRQLSQMPLLRRIGNMGLSFLTKAASGYWDVFDPTNGFTAIHARTLELMDLANVDRRWFFETSMLMELSLIRAVVRDVYIPAKYAAEQSTLSEMDALLHFPVRLSAALFKRFWIQYFVKDFSPVALFLMVGLVAFFFGFGWGAYHWIRVAMTSVEASTGTVMVAVLPLILGVQFLLQALVLDMQSVPKYPLSQNGLEFSD